MHINIIQTNSQGNLSIIDNTIAIDFSVAQYKVRKYIPDLEYIIISHEHYDHISMPLLNYTYKHNPQLIHDGLYVNISTLTKINNTNPTVSDIITHTITNNATYKLTTCKGVYTLETFPLLHDVENQGFIITAPNGETLIHATDTMTLAGSPVNRTYDYLMIEGNWDDTLLIPCLTDNNPAVRFRAQRNLRHLSVQACEKFMKQHGKNTSVYYQLHKSPTYGTNISNIQSAG